ncbi:MAG: flavodoxin family protein [Actinobacteria bacterium]|nr:flavodoxin family protein [Actinomycetota bacterium]
MMNGNIEDVKDFKLVAVYGSPRRGGNTDTLMNRFLEGVSSCSMLDQNSLNIDRIFTKNLKISSCRGCGSCSKTGECIIHDDMQALYGPYQILDFLAIASPIFFTTVSGYLKAFIDRFQRFWTLKYELKRKIIVKENRKGILISTSGSKSKDIFDCTKKVMRALFDVLYIEYFSDFLFNNTDQKDDIQKNQEALHAIYDFGKKGLFLKRSDD